MKAILPLQLFYCVCTDQLIVQQPTNTRVRDLRLAEYHQPVLLLLQGNLCSGSANLTFLVCSTKAEHI